jgi:hypothetical protein
MTRTLHANLSMLGFTMTMPLVAMAWAGTAPGMASSLTLMLLAIAAVSMTAMILKARRNTEASEGIDPALQHAGIPGSATVFVKPAMDRRLRS